MLSNKIFGVNIVMKNYHLGKYAQTVPLLVTLYGDRGSTSAIREPKNTQLTSTVPWP